MKEKQLKKEQSDTLELFLNKKKKKTITNQ